MSNGTIEAWTDGIPEEQDEAGALTPAEAEKEDFHNQAH